MISLFNTKMNCLETLLLFSEQMSAIDTRQKAVSEICVLANQVDVADDAICSPSGSKSIFSSGSPIEITSFRQSVVGEDKIQFSFDIVHSGFGNIFEPKTPTDTEGCPKDSSTRRSEEDKVKITNQNRNHNRCFEMFWNRFCNYWNLGRQRD